MNCEQVTMETTTTRTYTLDSPPVAASIEELRAKIQQEVGDAERIHLRMGTMKLLCREGPERDEHGEHITKEHALEALAELAEMHQHPPIQAETIKTFRLDMVCDAAELRARIAVEVADNERIVLLFGTGRILCREGPERDEHGDHITKEHALEALGAEPVQERRPCCICLEPFCNCVERDDMLRGCLSSMVEYDCCVENCCKRCFATLVVRTARQCDTPGCTKWHIRCPTCNQGLNCTTEMFHKCHRIVVDNDLL